MVLDAPTFNSMMPSKYNKFSEIILSKEQANSLRKMFINTSEEIKVPVIFDITLSLFTGLYLPARIGTASGLFYSHLFAGKINAASASIRDVGLFMAEGGRIYRRVSILRRESDRNFFALVSSEYTVSLGAESRTFVVFGCIYPIKILVSEFETKSPYNNKILKQIAPSLWRTWDLEDKRFSGDVYRYIKQESDYYLFERDAIVNNTVVGQDLYKISVTGGEWQVLHYNERSTGVFSILYPATVSR